MATTQASPRESAIRPGSPSRESNATEGPQSHDSSRIRRAARANRPLTDLPGSTNRRPGSPTDDEILGLDSSNGPGGTGLSPANLVEARGFSPADNDGREAPSSQPQAVAEAESPERRPVSSSSDAAEPENLRAAFDANPELRQAWHDAHSYRESFATPDEARAATALLADLDRLDALFYSRRPEDHAELARAVAALDPDAFASLAHAMFGLATEAQRHRDADNGRHSERSDRTAVARPGEARTSGREVEESLFSAPSRQEPSKRDPLALSRAPATADENQIARDSAQDDTPRNGPTSAQMEFFHSANAAAVRNVLDAIESQVERLLPDGVSKSARNRVVGEIYRELDSTLGSNRQLAQQMRDAFKSGSLDTNHQRAIVSLITGRARQALPGVAKRVLSEWTSTGVAANHDRRARQRAAESRVDIAGSSRAGNDGIRPMTPRDIDYARLSDSDILNM